MRESELRECEEMWTTNRDNYVITDDRQTLPNGHQMGYGIFEIAGNQLLVVQIEDKSLREAVTQRMLEAGVKVVPTVNDALAVARARA